jgi:hypothetical protein
MAVYYIVFALLALLGVGTRRTVGERYVLAGMLLFLMAALRSGDIDADYPGYLVYYDNVLYEGFVNVEPTFIAVANLIKATLDNPAYLFAFYAALGIGLKLFALNRITNLRLPTLLIYYSWFFLLWEMTQIRIAVAGAFLLLALPAIVEKRPREFIVWWLLASSFHYAAIIVGALYLLDGKTLAARRLGLLVPLAALLYLANFDLVVLADFAPIQLIELKIRSYETYADTDIDNIYNYVYLSRCALAYVLLLNWRTLAERNGYFIILLKIYFIGLFVHAALASIPGISSRLSELLLVVEVVLVPMLIYLFRERVAGTLVVTAAGLVFLTFSLFYTKLLKPYEVTAALFQ